MRNKELRIGTKYYERVKKALSHELLPSFTMGFTWEPPVSTVCPSSVAKYLTEKGYTVKLAPTEMKQHQEYSLRMPLLGQDVEAMQLIKAETIEFFASPHELVEYIGMVSLSCTLDQQEYVNSYVSQGKSMEIGSAKVVQWRGFFTTSIVERLLAVLK